MATRVSKSEARRNARYAVDNAFAPRKVKEAPENARYVGWRHADEGDPVFCAVWSYLGNELDAWEAEKIAADYLAELGWFGAGKPARPADYIST